MKNTVKMGTLVTMSSSGRRDLPVAALQLVAKEGRATESLMQYLKDNSFR